MTIRAPQVTDHVKEAPIRALRAVFASIGQLLLVADRLRREQQSARAGREDGRRDPPATQASSSRRAGTTHAARPLAGAATVPAKRAAAGPGRAADDDARHARTEPAESVTGGAPAGATRPAEPAPAEPGRADTRRAQTAAPPPGDRPGPAHSAETAAPPAGDRPATADSAETAAPPTGDRPATADSAETAAPPAGDRPGTAHGAAVPAGEGAPGTPVIPLPRSQHARSGAPARSPRRAAKQKAAEPTGRSEQNRWRSLDQTGNVRLLTSEDAADQQATPEQAGETAAAWQAREPAGRTGTAGLDLVPQATGPARATARQATTTVRLVPRPANAPDADSGATAGSGAAVKSGPAAESGPAKQSSQPGLPAAASLPEPLPGYDSWSVPSLRARLRNLNAAQVRALADYERATAGRAEVLTMLERRLVKLGSSAV